MVELFRRVWQIFLMRLGPDALPDLPLVVVMLTFCYWSVGAANLAVVMPLLEATFKSALDLLLLAAYAYLLLSQARLRHRFNQTLSALAGTGAAVSLLAWPLTAALFAMETDTSGQAAPLALGYVLLFAWNVVVFAFIFGRALNRTTPEGLLASLGFVALTVVVFQLLLPGQPA